MKYGKSGGDEMKTTSELFAKVKAGIEDLENKVLLGKNKLKELDRNLVALNVNIAKADELFK